MPAGKILIGISETPRRRSSGKVGALGNASYGCEAEPGRRFGSEQEQHRKQREPWRGTPGCLGLLQGALAQRGVVELFEENVSGSWFNMNWRIWGEEREGVYYLLITALAHSPHMHVEQVIDIQMTLEGMGSRRPFLEWSGERRQWVPGESSGRMHRVWCSSGSQKWRRGQRWLICSQPEILEKVIPLKKNRQNKKKKKFFKLVLGGKSMNSVLVL